MFTIFHSGVSNSSKIDDIKEKESINKFSRVAGLSPRRLENFNIHYISVTKKFQIFTGFFGVINNFT